MRSVMLIMLCLFEWCSSHSQSIQSTQITAPPDLQKIIKEADHTLSLSTLTTIVNKCAECCHQSLDISILLTSWLRESHPIYANRISTDVNQFRGFLLSSLNKFPPHEELYRYVKSELMFSGHPFNVAAAATTARNFIPKADELIPLMEPFLDPLFGDKWVDITTPALNYPIANPTKARYEIISTLIVFGAASTRSLKLLDNIVEYGASGKLEGDSILYNKALTATEVIRNTTPVCCLKDHEEIPAKQSLHLIGKRERKEISTADLMLLDQEGRPFRFDGLKKPFVLTFFYTQCANPLKCVSTVHRLGQLEELCIERKLTKKIGIYAMTLDADFDTPSNLKKFGERYSIRFDNNVKFLKNTGSPDVSFFKQLPLRVNYGGGSINQHGIQLFIFDQKGRLAAICDNDLWKVEDVYTILTELVRE